MKKTKYITVTIILGALGSAFWEICLKNIFFLLVNKIMPYLMQCFNDSFYNRVSRSLNSTSFSLLVYVMGVFMLLIVMPPNLIFKLFHSYQQEKKNRILQSVLRLSCIIAIACDFFIVIIASNTARDTINNIEIVSPYITENEYKQLRSNFLQMDSKSDYEILISEIEFIAKENGLQLK